MASRQPVLDATAVTSFIENLCEADAGGNRIGIELEWLTRPSGDPGGRVTIDTVERIAATARPLPAAGAVTFEPGGQLELSSRPARDVDTAVAMATTDAGALRHAARARGVDLLASGIDPVRSPKRVLDTPRYRAMETYFDRDGNAGRRMMCSTAAIQINVGCGPAEQALRRFRLASAIGPVLVAAFANSPVVGGRVNGWRSNRMATWLAMDPTRCAPVDIEGDLHAGWAAYARAARVMAVRVGGAHVVPSSSVSFDDWMRDGIDGVYPDTDDLAFHLSTLFPPVRLKGWLELRMIDALPSPYWEVAAAVAYSLLAVCDPGEVERAVTGTEHQWAEAARRGLDEPDLGAAAGRVFAIASEAAPPGMRDAVDSYRERFVGRHRCPADDVVDGRRQPAWT